MSFIGEQVKLHTSILRPLVGEVYMYTVKNGTIFRARQSNGVASFCLKGDNPLFYFQVFLEGELPGNWNEVFITGFTPRGGVALGEVYTGTQEDLRIRHFVTEFERYYNGKYSLLEGGEVVLNETYCSMEYGLIRVTQHEGERISFVSLKPNFVPKNNAPERAGTAKNLFQVCAVK
jgi:hypothetical protein